MEEYMNRVAGYLCGKTGTEKILLYQEEMFRAMKNVRTFTRQITITSRKYP
jgi:hypothetical protein